jgi:hypothetical protein
MSAQEEAAWRANLQAREDSEKAVFFAHAETLRRMWE